MTDVNLSRGTAGEQIRRFRDNLAKQIETLIDEGIVDPTTTVAEAIVLLRRKDDR